MNQKLSNKWGIWLLCVLFYAYRYFLYAMPNILKDDFCAYFQMSVSQFGQFSGIWYIGYIIAHIPMGIALDRFGPRYALPFSMMLCLIGAGGFLIPGVWYYPFVGRFLVGLGSAGATLGMFKIVSLFFDEKQFTKAISLTCIIGVMGAVFANYPLQILSMMVAWQNIVWGLIFVGIILFVGMLWLMPTVESDQQSSVLEDLKLILSNKNLWIVSLCAGLLSGPMEGFSDGWAFATLINVYDASKELASQASSIIYVGFIVGLLSTNVILSKMGLDKPILLCGWILLSAFILILMPIQSVILVLILYFLIGFLGFYQVPAVERAIFFFDKKHAALATASFNMIMNAFGPFFHTTISQGMDFLSGHAQNKIVQYQLGLAIIPIMILFGTLFYALNYKHFKNNPKS